MATCARDTATKKQSNKCLVVQGGEIGVTNRGVFQSHTNFSMEIAHAVTSSEGAPCLFGYVYIVKSSSGIQRYVSLTSLYIHVCLILNLCLCRECFISTDDAQTRSFVRAASKTHPHLQWAKIPERLWSIYL